MTRVAPTVRADIELLPGYHSAQVDVDVRLNTNESPVPPPGALTARLAEAVATVEWNRYPDRAATALREAIAAHHACQPDQVFAANGSNEVLYTILHAFGGAGRTALTFEPTYALHAHLARLSGTTVVEEQRDDGFAIDESAAIARIDDLAPALVFVCSPNNPTGLADPPALIDRLLETVEGYGGLLVVDEAYGQFADHTAIGRVGLDRNLLVTRTFSKTWAMAGLRLGHAVGSPTLVSELHKVSLPYHLDSFTQHAGRLALQHVDEMRARVADLQAERSRLDAGLRRLPVDVWPSQANFILFRPRGRPAGDVWQALVDRSVLVRDCSSWPRLAGCLRVTVGTVDEDDRFLDALAAVLSQ